MFEMCLMLYVQMPSRSWKWRRCRRVEPSRHGPMLVTLPGPSRAGPGRHITPPFCMSWDRDAEGWEGGDVGRDMVVPSQLSIGVQGSVLSFPSGVRGGAPAPAENGFYAYFRSERSHLEHHFQYFWATAGPPNVAGPGKTFYPFSPLDGPEHNPYECTMDTEWGEHSSCNRSLLQPLRALPLYESLHDNSNL